MLTWPPFSCGLFFIKIKFFLPCFTVMLRFLTQYLNCNNDALTYLLFVFIMHCALNVDVTRFILVSAWLYCALQCLFQQCAWLSACCRPFNPALSQPETSIITLNFPPTINEIRQINCAVRQHFIILSLLPSHSSTL